MAKSVEVTRTTRGALSGDEAEELFSGVDETGHTSEETAKRKRRAKTTSGTDEFDPLTGGDPSGADTDRLITRSAIMFVSIFVVAVVLIQVGWGYVRRVTTSTLAEDASIRSVVSALNMGVEWGGGFTQFPSEFTVQEADEHTHRIEVTVIDSSSTSELDAFATAQVQASALSVNALLNPNIDTVIYHVKIRQNEAGRFQKTTFFGFLRPTGAATPFTTFVWTKTAADDGVRFDCAITGMDNSTQERLHDTITSKSTPATIISYVIGDGGAVVAENVLSASADSDSVREQMQAMAAAAEEARLEAEAAAKAAAEAAAAAESDSEDQADDATTDATESSNGDASTEATDNDGGDGAN